MKLTLNYYFMKCLERKISRCILPLTKLFVSMVKELIKQFFIRLRFEGVVFSNEYKGNSFVVVNKKLKKEKGKK